MSFGDQWIEELPSRWESVPAKALFRERRELSEEGDVHLTPSQRFGVLPQSEYMRVTGNRVVLNVEGADRMKRVMPDDFVIHLRSFQGGIEHSSIPGKVSVAYTVLEPRPGANPRFFRWVLKSQGYIQEIAATSNQLRDGQSLKYQHFAQVRLPHPPSGEQAVIADFLDRETTRIDRLMYAQETLIATLHERRASLISRALSRGTNFEELTIGSGMAGGPEKRRLKWHFSERDERSGEKSAELPLLSVSANWGVRRRSTVTDELSRAEDHSAYKVAYEGDLAINRMLAYQGALGVVPEKGLVSPDYSVLEINSDLNAKWLEYLMRSSFFVFEMSRRVRGIGGIADVNVRTPRLNVRDLGNIAISAPPVREQEAIVDYLDLETVRIDGLIEKAEAFVRIAAERRAALITAAVTGRVDVMEEFIG